MSHQSLLKTAKSIFALTAVSVILIFTWTYAREVSSAKQYTATECQDSMTRVQCDHPYSGSIFCASVGTVFLAGPIALGGFVVGTGIMLYTYNKKEPDAPAE